MHTMLTMPKIYLIRGKLNIDANLIISLIVVLESHSLLKHAH